MGEIWERDGYCLGNELEQMGKRWANIGTLEKRWVSIDNSLREDYGKSHGKPMILKQYPLVN